ncbi:MAG: YihY family inner membrane protein [Legionellales bacterium]
MDAYLKKLPFYRREWFQFLVFLITRFERNYCRERAAALTYTTMLSIIPMLTVFLVVLSTIPALAPARVKVQETLYSYLLPESSTAVTQYLNDFAEKSTNLTIIGIIFLFFTSIMMLSSIEDAFNKIWHVKNLRGGAIGFMRYWMVISLGPLFLGTAFALPSAIASIEILNSNFAGYSIDWSVWLKLITVTITLMSFTFMYWMIPNRKVPLKNAAYAGIIAGVSFELLKIVFGFFMKHFTSYEIVYGAFAALPVFLLWIYLSWNIVLLGVEISYALTMFRHSETPPRHPLLSLLYILHLFYMRQKIGCSVSEADMMSLLGKKEVEDWPDFINILQEQSMIRKTDKGDYVLCRNLDQIDFWTFYQGLPFPLPRREDLQNCNVNTPSGDEWSMLILPYLSETDTYLAKYLSIPLSQLLDAKLKNDAIEAHPKTTL